VKHCDPQTIALLALGEEPVDSDAVHLVTCDECRTEWESLRHTADIARSLDNDYVVIAPPPSVWAAVSAQIAASPEVTALDSRRSRRWVPWVAVADAAGVLFGGIGGVALTRSSTPAPAIVATPPLAPLADYSPTGSASVELVADAQILAVDVSNLPATDGYFEVWLLAPDASSMIAVGTLGAGQSSTFPLPAGVSLSDYPVVDISVEQYDGDPTHSTDSVARGTLPA